VLPLRFRCPRKSRARPRTPAGDGRPLRAARRGPDEIDDNAAPARPTPRSGHEPRAVPRSRRQARPRDERFEASGEWLAGHGEAGEAAHSPRSSRGGDPCYETPSGRTRDPEASCARLLDPDCARADAISATNGSNLCERARWACRGRRSRLLVEKRQLRETGARVEPHVVDRPVIDDGAGPRADAGSNAPRARLAAISGPARVIANSRRRLCLLLAFRLSRWPRRLLALARIEGIGRSSEPALCDHV
jgi:hypothetical protein